MRDERVHQEARRDKKNERCPTTLPISKFILEGFDISFQPNFPPWLHKTKP